MAVAREPRQPQQSRLNARHAHHAAGFLEPLAVAFQKMELHRAFRGRAEHDLVAVGNVPRRLHAGETFELPQAPAVLEIVDAAAGAVAHQQPVLLQSLQIARAGRNRHAPTARWFRLVHEQQPVRAVVHARETVAGENGNGHERRDEDE